jgi:hypothetical protein
MASIEEKIRDQFTAADALRREKDPRTDHGPSQIQRDMEMAEKEKTDIEEKIVSIQRSMQLEMERLELEAEGLRTIASTKIRAANEIRKFLYPQSQDEGIAVPDVPAGIV